MPHPTHRAGEPPLPRAASPADAVPAAPHRASGLDPAARATRTFTQRLKAPPERVFPLLCPVRETEWLDGWAAEVLRSESGIAEEGCVFRTHFPGEPETIWIVTRHEPSTGRVDFARVTAGLAATRLCVQVRPAGQGESSVEVTYEFTPTSAEGERLVARRHAEGAFAEAMEWWERSMNHYLETGATLRPVAGTRA